MNEGEKQLLEKLVKSNEGMLSQREFTSGENKRRTAQKLIALKLVEEFQYKNIPSYRATEKGRMIFEPYINRVWFSIKGSMGAIIVSTITAIIVAIITTLITNHYGK